jgi:phage FluMu protein gp41
MGLKLKNFYRRFFNAGATRETTSKEESVIISKSGSVVVDREALHSSERFRRQIEALGKIDAKLRRA